MGTPSLRIRLVFEDRSILTKAQRSDGMIHTWLLLKSQQHPTISDVCNHLLHIFKLHRSCPNGIMLSMEGFALPPFESTEILKEKEIICVKKKGGSTADACDLLDDALEPVHDGLLLLANDNFDKETKEYQSEFEVDEEQSQDKELPEETISKKRKASTNLHKAKKKKQCLAASGDEEDEAKTEETDNINNDASHPMKISSMKETNKIAATSNKRVQSLSTVKRSEELQENVKEVNQVSNASGAIKLYWKQASKKHVQNRDMCTDVGLIETKRGHIRFESFDEDHAAKQTVASTEKLNWNGSSGKKKSQEQGRGKFSTFRRNEQHKRINQESFKSVFKDSKVPVIDPNDFDKLPPCSEPKEGDVIAYRLLELSSSWIAELSSFRVGRISYYDAKDIVLIPVIEYPIVSDKINEDGPNDSLYGEDGTLEINYSALVDVRNVQQYNPAATEALNDGVNQTPMSDDKDAAKILVSNSNDNNIDVPKDSNPGEVNPWDHFSSKNTEITEPNNLSMIDSGLNPSSYGGAGPSTSAGPDANNKTESSEVKEVQIGNSINPWSNTNKPDTSQENNSGWSNVLAPTANDCENGSSWGRPWSAFAVSKSSTVIQHCEENKRHAGSSRGNWKPMSRGAPRGRGRGRGGRPGRGRGRNSD